MALQTFAAGIAGYARDNRALAITANPHGVKNGWFSWPFNFDPVWLESCSGFERLHDRKGWIGVDLDGCLAHYDGWRGAENIGDPVPAMFDRVKAWLAEGREVRIVTARAGLPEQVPYIKAWLVKYFGRELPITDRKDFGMYILYDDRCVQVEKNTGRLITDSGGP